MTSPSRTRFPELDEDLEKQLKISLRPVDPNPVFIEHLQNRLLTTPEISLERRNTALSMLLVAMSMVFGLFLVWITHRLRRAAQSRSAPFEPA